MECQSLAAGELTAGIRRREEIPLTDYFSTLNLTQLGIIVQGGSP